jgi:hypothetical protein
MAPLDCFAQRHGSLARRHAELWPRQSRAPHFWDLFRQRLRELANVEGENVASSSAGRWQRRPSPARGRIGQVEGRCHRYHVNGRRPAAKGATNTTDRHGNRQRSGACRTCRQPFPAGGNVTGIATLDSELQPKRQGFSER